MEYRLERIWIKRFRSLMNVEVDFTLETPVIICGENNIGKTNVLQALNVFFNHKTDTDVAYAPENDIPHHIFYGRGGITQNTEISALFRDNHGERVQVKVTFRKDFTIDYYVEGIDEDISDELKFSRIINKFKFFLVESNNINIPSLVSELFSSDGLSMLDKKRAKQQRPLEVLREFQKKAQEALDDIQKGLNQELQKLNILNENGNFIKITFAEFERLRDVVSKMTEITLDDGNDHPISLKGSGAQRTVLLTLMNYIASVSRSKTIIWGLDEPEAFLQPKAQKELFKAAKRISKEQDQKVILTTHSQHFIELSNLKSTYLYKCEVDEKIYRRRQNKVFNAKSTYPESFNTDGEKANSIREHLGIENNDGWSVLPFTIMVEGNTDKEYLEAVAEQFQENLPNVVVAGSASKISGMLQFFDTSVGDLGYKPEVVVVLDNDEAGRDEYRNIQSKLRKYKNIGIRTVFYPRWDGKEQNDGKKLRFDWEVEDFLPPDLVFDSINRLLKKARYKVIYSRDREKKLNKAFVDEQILKYADSIIRMTNDNKEIYSIENDGQKMSLCKEALQLIVTNDYDFSETHRNFIQKIKPTN